MITRRGAGRGLRIFLGTLTALAVLSGPVRLVVAGEPQSSSDLTALREARTRAAQAEAAEAVAAQTAPCQELVLDFAGLPKGTLLGEQYAAQGIHISADANEAGKPDQLIVFDSNASGTRDPQMEVDIGNLAIIPEHLIDANGDGLVDDPNNTQGGGRQIYTFDHDRIVRSFVIVDIDHGHPSTPHAVAFDANGNQIVRVPLIIGPGGNVQTVQVNVSGVRRLEIFYRDSAGVTNIDLGCAPVPPPAPVAPGKITIVKNTVPDGPQDFGFTAGGGLPGFSLDDDSDPALANSMVFPNLAAGVYPITESQAAGWAQSVTCNNTDQDTTASGRVATIDLDPGEEITCTFTNSSLAGAIAVDKTVSPGVIQAGGTVTYTYKVTNTGTAVLHAVTISDNKCSPVSGPTGDNGNGVLDLQETWTYTCTTTISVDTTNVVTVGALNPADQPIGPVTDTASVDVINPGLTIEKTSDVDSGSPGDTVTFSFKVTNTGDTTLTDISVDDDVLGHIGDIATLAPGQSVTLTETFTLGDSDHVNVGTAEAEEIIGIAIKDDDKVQVDVVLGEEVTEASAQSGEEVSGGALATTGSDLLRMALLAMFLLAMGGTLQSRGRRRAKAERP